MGEAIGNPNFIALGYVVGTFIETYYLLLITYYLMPSGYSRANNFDMF